MKLSDTVSFSKEELESLTQEVVDSQILEKEEKLKKPDNRKEIVKPTPEIVKDTPKKTPTPRDPSKSSDYDLVDQILQTPQFTTQKTYKKKDLEKALESLHGRKIKIQQMTWSEERPNKPAIIFKTDKAGVYSNKYHT
jgi:hypothetical protein